MTDEASLVKAALAYTELGWAVIPVHSARGGRCSCQRSDCPAVGKHPRVRWRGYIDDAPEADEVRAWWKRWPDANLGVITGRVSGVAVLDVDPRAGGDAALADLVERWGSLPKTPETRTGGGGRHLWFMHPEASLPSAVIGAGLELKATGGTVVVPPSRHASGRRYEWIPGRNPWAGELAPLPGWLSAMASGTVAGTPRRHPLGAPPARTGEEKDEFARAWSEAGISLLEGDLYYVCPFHDDHDPSLHIDAEACRWFCFGCRRGGGIGALRHVAGRPGTPARRSRLTGTVGRDEPVTLPGEHRVDVVGESHHQDELLAITGGERRYGGVDVGAVACLSPEPANRFDEDAVMISVSGAHVGYLRHVDAVRLRPTIDAAIRHHGVATCRAKIRGGWDRGRGDIGAFGVVLQLPAPD